MRVRRIRCKFWPGDVVYLKVAPEKIPGIVRHVAVCLGGSIVLAVGWGDGEATEHYEAELTAEYVPDYARDGGDGGDDGDGETEAST